MINSYYAYGLVQMLGVGSYTGGTVVSITLNLVEKRSFVLRRNDANIMSWETTACITWRVFYPRVLLGWESRGSEFVQKNWVQYFINGRKYLECIDMTFFVLFKRVINDYQTIVGPLFIFLVEIHPSNIGRYIHPSNPITVVKISLALPVIEVIP